MQLHAVQQYCQEGAKKRAQLRSCKHVGQLAHREFNEPLHSALAHSAQLVVKAACQVQPLSVGIACALQVHHPLYFGQLHKVQPAELQLVVVELHNRAGQR
jgi:hypothetical protein